MIEFMDRWSAFILANIRLLSIILFSLLTLWNVFNTVWAYKQPRRAQLSFRHLWKGYLLTAFANALLVLGLLIKFNRPMALIINVLILSFLGPGLFLIFKRKKNEESSNQPLHR